MKTIFPLRITTHESTIQVGAVSVAPGRLLSAHHVVRDRQVLFGEVQIAGEWHTASISATGGHDLISVTINRRDLPTIGRDIPRYGDRLKLYGLKTQTVQHGLLSNFEKDYAQLSLDVGEPGIEIGDSGGGVFNSEGKLVGIISARNPREKRVVYFTTWEEL